MRPYHISLAVLVAIIWGCNFIFIKVALIDIPPFLLCAIRFFIVSIPAVFFIKKPAVPFQMLASYALFTFALQFALLFAGMHAGMPAGLSSIVAQTQVFFSLFFAIIFLNERPTRLQIVGAIISFVGIGVVWTQISQVGSLFGFILILCAAMSWGMGNVYTKRIGRVNSLALVAWGALFATPPLLLLSLFVEGIETITYSLHHLSLLTIASVLFIAYISTWLGYGIWNWLIGQYMMSTIVPFGLLVPFVGMFSSIVILDEMLQPWKIIAGGLMILGLCINVFGPQLQIRYQQRMLRNA